MAEVTARCQRCKGIITASRNEERFFICPQCGTRLRAATAPSLVVATPSITSPGEPASPAPPSPVPPGDGAARPADGFPGDIRLLLKGQEESLCILREILAILRFRPASAGGDGPAPSSNPLSGELGAALPAPPQESLVRKRRRRKTVLIVDDDDEARQMTEAAFVAAQVPVRAVADGRAAMTAIATEKPDVIILELGLPEPMTGRDVISMIKATMEWLDIPIVLYTRLPIESQKEARIIHGADDLVLKGSVSADTLVTRAIQIFQRE